MNNLNNTTERRPQAVFTKWDYATGEQLAQRRVFMDPISFIESIQELWPDEHAIHFDKNKNAYVGAFGIPENENEIPFLYRFELALL